MVRLTGKPAYGSFIPMGRRTVKVLVVLSMFCSACKEEAVPKAVPVAMDGQISLKVMTLNLRNENTKDSGERAWRSRVPLIVRLVRGKELQVFGIQEGFHGQIADLWASLPEYDFYGLGRVDGKKSGEYAGIFFRRDSYEKDPGASGMMWLSETPDAPGSASWGNTIPRVATWVRLIDRASGRPFFLLNTHLDHRSQISREKSVRQIASKIVEMNPENDPVVWMGDFNAVERNQIYRFVSGKKSSLETVEGFTGLKEVYEVMHPTKKDRGTLHFWMSDPSRQWKVDHIFVSQSAEIRSAEVVKSGPPYISDHFPVIAEFSFPAED